MRADTWPVRVLYHLSDPPLTQEELCERFPFAQRLEFAVEGLALMHTLSA
jgi:hypothetical protein